MKESKLIQRYLGYITYFFCILISAIIFFSCNSDRFGEVENAGILQLSLMTDTTVVNNGAVVTRATPFDWTPFLDTEKYKIEILKGEENTVVRTFEQYKDMPDIIELERGNYKIRASFGKQVPAAFESPHFQGVSEFIIKQDMTTKLDLTCALTNARATVYYTDSCKMVYPKYAVAFETTHTTEPFEFIQDETRSAWFQVNENGEDLKGVLTVTPDEGEMKQFSVTVPSVKPKDDIRLTFNSTPDTRPDRGLTVRITINDKTIEKPLYIYVPDYMLPVDGPLVEPVGFANEDPIVLGTDDIIGEANVKMSVPGTIENCRLLIWEDQAEAIEYDLAHLDDTGKADLLAKGFVLSDIWHKKQATIDFRSVIERLPRIPEGETNVKLYNYQLIVTDSLVNAHTSKPLTLVVKMVPDVAPKITLSDGFVSSQAICVTEGGIIYNDGVKINPEYKATIKSTRELSACLLKITDATGMVNSYNLTNGELVPGIKYNLKESVPYVNFKEAISSLVLDDDNIKRYEYELTVQTEFEGSTYEDVKTLIVDLIPPKFEMSMNGDKEENGDAFAKRAVLRATATTCDASKLSFQLYKNGQWTDVNDQIEGTLIVKGDVTSAVLTGLEAETQYRVRAKYGNHVSEEMTFTTEKIDTYIPNSEMEEWSYYTVNNKYVFWKKWYPWAENKKEARSWNTINLKTTQYAGTSPSSVLGIATAPYVGTTYVANSGTISTTDGMVGMAALIRTVGWGQGNKADNSDPQNVSAGEFYLGDYDEFSHMPIYGVDFQARPTGFSFYYKYEPKNSSDYFIARIVLLDKDENVIASSELPPNEAVSSDSYKKKVIYIDYKIEKPSLKAKKMYILFKSGVKISANKDDVNYPSFGNLKDGEFVGSKLYVDNVEVFYE